MKEFAFDNAIVWLMEGVQSLPGGILVNSYFLIIKFGVERDEAARGRFSSKADI